MQKYRPVMLVIMDGWGFREDPADNAVRQAHTPAFDRLWATCPHALLRTSGKDVGLTSLSADQCHLSSEISAPEFIFLAGREHFHCA